MLTLDLTNAPFWCDLVPGVRVKLRPLTTALMVASRADPAIAALAEKYGALTMVDDCHATGFMGARGRGTHEQRGELERDLSAPPLQLRFQRFRVPD